MVALKIKKIVLWELRNSLIVKRSHNYYIMGHLIENLISKAIASSELNIYSWLKSKNLVWYLRRENKLFSFILYVFLAEMKRNDGYLLPAVETTIDLSK